MSSMIPLTILSLDTNETVRNLYIIFRSALVLSSALIHVLAHFQRTTCSQNYFRFSPYLLRKTAFICNIDRDWMIYRKHPIRSLLTSMLRKASFRYPSDVYAPGTDPGFQVRGGTLKKNCVERRVARKFLGYFVWKITILRQKIIFFSNFRIHPCALSFEKY